MIAVIVVGLVFVVLYAAILWFNHRFHKMINRMEEESRNGQ